MRASKHAILFVSALCSVSLGACAKVIGIDDFHVESQCTPGSADEMRTLSMQFLDMTAHREQKTVIEIDDNTDNARRSLAVLEGFPSTGNFLLVMPGAIDPGSWRLDFYSDFDGNGMYSGLPTESMDGDHAWRRMGTDTGCMTFQHTFAFQDILQGQASVHGGDMTLMITGASELAGRPLEVHLVLVSPERTQGFYRFQRSAGASLTAQLKGIVDGGNTYRIEVWSDANDDDTYQPSVDASWVINAIVAGSGPNAIVRALDLSTDPQAPLPR